MRFSNSLWPLARESPCTLIVYNSQLMYSVIELNHIKTKKSKVLKHKMLECKKVVFKHLAMSDTSCFLTEWRPIVLILVVYSMSGRC
jgi:hypothetical protein